VKQGDAVIELEDPLLDAHLKVLEAQRKELKVEYDATQYEDRVEAQKISDELKSVEASLVRARERIDDLIVRSASDGKLVVPQAQDLPGRFVRHGEPVAYVVDFSEITARVVVPQADVGLVRRDTQGVEVRFANDIATNLPASILREVPAADDRLPSAALGATGGGNFQVDPQDEQGTRTLDPIFQFDLSLPPDTVITKDASTCASIMAPSRWPNSGTGAFVNSSSASSRFRNDRSSPPSTRGEARALSAAPVVRRRTLRADARRHGARRPAASRGETRSLAEVPAPGEQSLGRARRCGQESHRGFHRERQAAIAHRRPYAVRHRPGLRRRAGGRRP
jgi:hypothetical protein